MKTEANKPTAPTPVGSGAVLGCGILRPTISKQRAAWIELKLRGGRIRIGIWNTCRRTILRTHRNTFLPETDWELDVCWFSIAYKAKQPNGPSSPTDDGN